MSVPTNLFDHTFPTTEAIAEWPANMRSALRVNPVALRVRDFLDEGTRPERYAEALGGMNNRQKVMERQVPSTALPELASDFIDDPSITDDVERFQEAVRGITAKRDPNRNRSSEADGPQPSVEVWDWPLPTEIPELNGPERVTEYTAADVKVYDDTVFDTAPWLSATWQASIPALEAIDYAFREDEYVTEARDHIDRTYGAHYAGKFQATSVIIDAGHGTGFNIGNIIKYAKRYGKKAGYNRTDLLKIIHYAVMQLYVHDEEGLDKGEKKVD